MLAARQDLPLDLGVTGERWRCGSRIKQISCSCWLQLGHLAVTSANLHGLPPAQTVAEAKEYFGDKVVEYLDAGPSQIGEPSTIVKVAHGDYSLLRMGAIAPSQLAAVASKETKG